MAIAISFLRYPHPKPLSSGEGLAAEAAIRFAQYNYFTGERVRPATRLRPS